MSGHMIERTTVRLPQDLLDRAKRKAAAEGRTLTSLIEDGLRLVVADDRKFRKRVLPPVSKAAGGPMPGVDLMDLSALQETDDLDYVGRMKRPPMILPDVNVLIYAFRRDMPQHAVCRPWLVDVVSSDARFGLSPTALSAVVRITTNPRAYRIPSAIDEAFAFCDNLLHQPHCEIVQPRERHWDIFKQLLHSHSDARSPRDRRVVRGACHRVGLRAGHV
jgi:uncharacterized protein